MTDPFSPNTNPQPQSSTKRKVEPVIIKKYANRRLYNTASSTYVTLESLAEMVRDDIEFMVVDAKTGDDLTRPVLTQIIVDQEAKGTNLLPIPFLRQLISMYGDNMQWFVPNYLEQTMQHFTDNQQKLQDYLQQTFGAAANPASMSAQMGAMFPFNNMPKQSPSMTQPMETFQAVSKQMVEQNKAMMEQAQQFMTKMFMPFAGATAPTGNTQEKSDTLNALKQKIASLEAELKNSGN